MSTEDVKPIKVKKLPLLLTKQMLIKNRNIKVMKALQSPVQEDIIYTSKQGDFTWGEVRRMTIVNRLSVGTNSSKTIARCQSHSGQVFEKTSDEVTKLIGQENYDILITSLCSIINQELKIRSINALLTVPKKSGSVACQTETNSTSFSEQKNTIDSACQTMETCSPGRLTSLDGLKKDTRPRKRNKRQHLQPYVVKDAPEVKQQRRLVISPDKFETFVKTEKEPVQTESLISESSLPELGTIFDEDSINSIGRFSALSVTTTPDLLENPLNILSNVDKHTRDVTSGVNQCDVEARGRYQNMRPVENVSFSQEKLPFDTQEVLKRFPPEQRIKLLLRQGLTDLKDCLTTDADGYLPIHVAILSNDVDLLRRQCLVLKMRGSTVDVTANGQTPLRLSLLQENTMLTSTLLHFGADVLDADDEDRTVFHEAAQLNTDHLHILLNYCQQNARKVMFESDHLWRESYSQKTDEELAPVLLNYINKLYDNQGYTPLMVASRLGRYNNVLALVESSRQAVNLAMPSSGSTALFLAVSSACIDAAERGNKAKIVDHFSRTIEILVENGADPGIDNFSGSSVNDLLTEFNIAELSMLIANKLTSIKFFDGHLPSDYKGTDFMLVKDNLGHVNLKDIKTKKNSGKTPPSKDAELTSTPTHSNKTHPTVTVTKTSPVIIENVEYKPPIKPELITVPGNVQKQRTDLKVDPENLSPLIKNFKLNKPVIITSAVQNNKRKLDIIVETSKIKKTNQND